MSIIGTLPNTTNKSSVELARERNRRWYWKNPESNTGIGHMKDDPCRLRKAAEYLEKARS